MKSEDALHQLSSPWNTWGIGMDFWSALCILCKREGVTTEADLTRVTRQFEAEYRQQTHATSMPTKYRSAKSTLNKALVRKIPYIDNVGIPRGKNAVFQDCK